MITTNPGCTHDMHNDLRETWLESDDMVCYEEKVPVDIELFNERADIENRIDPLITRAIKLLKPDRSKGGLSSDDANDS